MNAATGDDTTPRQTTVLIVDDQPENLTVLTKMLQAHYRVRAARSGEQALRAAVAEPMPDLVLLDIMMPEMDGYTVLTRLRENPATRNIPVIFATALDAEEDEQRGLDLGAVDYINKPIKQSILLARVRTHITLGEQYRQLKVLNASLDTQVQERTRQLREALSSLETANERLKAGFMSTVHVFSNLLEMREKEMLGHSRRVADNARKIAVHLKLPETDIQNVTLAGLVHDIGKIGLPDQLFSKPFASLSAEERKEMIQHPERGADVLAGLEQFHEAAKLIRWHHECFDGSGFPDGLRGEDIPLGARILAVANEYDALLCGMLLNKKLSRSGAMNFLMANAKKRYDPQVVDAFFKLKAGAYVARGENEGDEIETIENGVIRRTRSLRRISRSLPVSDLKPGMVITKPINLSEGMMLLSEGYILTQGVIDQLTEIQEARGRPLLYVDVTIRV